MRLKLANLTFIDPAEYFAPFTVARYTFHSQSPRERIPRVVTTPEMMVRENRRIAQNAYVEFAHDQDDSILFKGGLSGNPRRPRRRKLLEDILVLGSILTAHNWALFSRRDHPSYPVVAANHLRLISHNETEITADLTAAIATLHDVDWQGRFRNGFHVTSLFNANNLLVSEARFLSNVVIWEFLYARIFQESDNLHEIMKGLLEHFWPNDVDQTVFQNGRNNGVSSNVFYVLRNQLAHSGLLPIDRGYAEQWMTTIPLEYRAGLLSATIFEYMDFFNTLTQVIVLKTLGLHVEARLGTWNFSEHLLRFLATGRI